MWKNDPIYQLPPKKIITVAKARVLYEQDPTAFTQKLINYISMGQLANENIGTLSFEADLCPKGLKHKHFVTCDDGQITIHFDRNIVQFNNEPIF